MSEKMLWRCKDETPTRIGSRVSLLGALLAGALIFSGCAGRNEQTVQADNPNPNVAANQPLPGLDDQPPIQAVDQAPAAELPLGTTLSVRLFNDICSSSAQAGDEFDAELAAPVMVNGQTMFDAEAHVRVRVLAAEASGRLRHPGYLRVTVAAIRNPRGTWEPVRTTAISAKGKSHERRNITIIGGVAAVGSAIGAIAGGGKGAVIGAVSGAGAGTAGAHATGEVNVTFPAEIVLKFRTIRDTALKH